MRPLPGAARPPWGFYRTQALLLAAAALVLAWLFHATRLDLRLATPWYDPINHTFPWRYAWVTKYLVHRYLKDALLLAGACVWLVALWTWLRPRAHGFFASHRRRWWCVAWCFIAVPVTIGLLRRLSAMHCPWDIGDFGGQARYFDLLSAVPAGAPAGHCFPAAFVASGSWLLSLALLWYPEHKRRSLLVGAAALLLAFAMGWVQQMRGAHFLSHTLWSLWVSWVVVLVVHALGGAWRDRPGDAG